MNSKSLKANDVSKTTCKLIKELKRLFDDREFIMGILVYADNEEDRQELLNYIEKGDDVSVETVTVMALDLNDVREKEEGVFAED